MVLSMVSSAALSVEFSNCKLQIDPLILWYNGTIYHDISTVYGIPFQIYSMESVCKQENSFVLLLRFVSEHFGVVLNYYIRLEVIN